MKYLRHIFGIMHTNLWPNWGWEYYWVFLSENKNNIKFKMDEEIELKYR
jgi:hypothetical protein